MKADDEPRRPTRRLVVLGASNVARSLATIVDTARHTWNEPLELLIAAGHGRSYGNSSTVLGRQLPAIRQCSLWQALEQRPALPTSAVVTDVGNDILYGADADAIADWVQQCLARLSHCERLVLTELPLETVSAVGSGRFLMLRTLSYPSSRIGFKQALERAMGVNERLRNLAKAYGAVMVSPAAGWFGYDPVHIRMRQWTRAWQSIFAPLHDRQLPPVAHPSWRQRLRLVRFCPHERRLFGIRQHRQQPAAVLEDGSTLSLY